MLVHATDAVSAQALKNRMADDQRLKLDAFLRPDYYAEQTKSGAPIQFVGTIVAIVMAIGSCFAAMNTMYAAVAYRSREIATLRILGFSRPSIITSFVARIGAAGAAGSGARTDPDAAVQWSDHRNGQRADLQRDGLQHSHHPERNDHGDHVCGGMGLFGGIAPAWHASRREILAALRD